MDWARTHRRRFLQQAVYAAGGAIAASSGLTTLGEFAQAQANTDQLAAVLKQQIQTPDVVEFQLRQYLMKRVAPLPSPKSADEWTAESKRLRQHALELIFHGWPAEWVNAKPEFQDVGLIPSGSGYTLRKLRFQIVPGFWSTALLYEPKNISSRVPATLNLNGHTPQGKAAEYKQKRCINNALQGMYALSLEWLGMGELGVPENSHWAGAYLNLVGMCATGLFYLAMRKGLDYLCAHPGVDPKRIGVTGLSGGAWQTITLSALDERVYAAIPISGYFALISAIERSSDVGDIEYNTPDMRVRCDSAVLTALRAPRPTLLVYGAEDEYGMRAPLEKPHLYDDIKPFYQLYGKEDAFAFYENIDPGTHNYQLDNREKSYAFFTRHFGMPLKTSETPVDNEIKSCEELVVGLPKDNLTMLSLAKRTAAGQKRVSPGVNSDWATSARQRLIQVIRYSPVTVKHAWQVSSTRNKGVETQSFRLEFTNELSATAVLISSIRASAQAPTALLTSDEGFQTVRSQVYQDPSQAPILSECRANSVAWHVNRGEHVMVLNVIFIGDSSPDKFGEARNLWDPSALYTQLISSLGERPLGLEASQVIASAKWLRSRNASSVISVESTGIRSQVLALIASALEPDMFSQVLVREGMKSLSYLLEKPVTYQEAPELFCLDLYKEFDIDALAAMSRPTNVKMSTVLTPSGACATLVTNSDTQKREV